MLEESSSGANSWTANSGIRGSASSGSRRQLRRQEAGLWRITGGERRHADGPAGVEI